MDDHDDMQGVMEQIMAGRTRDLRCPFCKAGTLESKPSPYGTRFTCPECRRYIDAPAMD
jgi:hypothetical protein